MAARPPPTLASIAEKAGVLRDLVLAEVPDAVALYVFGSTASGSAHEASDVDLAILAARPIRADHRLELEGGLADAMGREVDLVDLRRASTVLQAQVVANGELLVDIDRVSRELFEVFVFASYARLNEERAEILRQVTTEGRVTAPVSDG